MKTPGWLSGLSLRAKVFITVAGVAVALLGLTTYLSFQYWRVEALEAAESQALLAAGSSRAALEAALVVGPRSRARQILQRIVADAPLTSARVYDREGRIILSADPQEEGTRPPGVWIPHAAELPPNGLVRTLTEESVVQAYLPIDTPARSVFQVEFSVAQIIEAMDKGARLGVGLTLASAVALMLVLLAMLEREVVAPIERVEGMLATRGGGRGIGTDTTRRPGGDVGRLQESVAELVASEKKAVRKAEESESQLLAKEGMAQVGELAAEMAHEFKRPLASIRTAVEVLEQKCDQDESTRQLLEAVNGQLRRLGETMQDLFSLAKPLDANLELIPVTDLLDDAVMELAGFPGAGGIRLARDYEEGLGDIAGDRRRLQQAFLNIMVNAVEAMPEGGVLTVQARHWKDEGILFEFQDTGPGIPPEKIAAVVVPFYSTKPQGTGLGLPLVARVVDAHRGSLRIETPLEGGTLVRVLLPVRVPAALRVEETTV